MQKFNSPRSKVLLEVVFLVTLINIFQFLYIPEVLAGEDRLAKGKILYDIYCAGCHGPKGKGDGYTLLDPPPADLTSEAVQKKSYDELWHEVHNGIPDTAMGMWKIALSDEEITNVLAYVRSLAE